MDIEDLATNRWMNGKPLTYDERVAALKLNYARSLTENWSTKFTDKVDEWDGGMYLALGIELAELMRQWTSNVGLEKEFKDWLVAFFNDKSWYEASGPDLLNAKSKLLIEASRKDGRKRKAA